MSIRAASTPASFNLLAVERSMTPVCAAIVSPSSLLILAIASTNLLMGTDPSGKHPPLMRQPTAPRFFSFAQRLKSFFGVRAGDMVSRTFPLQCLHSRAQEEPVIEIDGKAVGEEQKYLVL